jgi:hypothetical protein
VGQTQYEWDSANQTWRLLGTATAVTPGTYGDSANVGQFTVDTQGRLTSAVNVPISATIPDLQTVTTQGAVTTDTIDVGGLVAAGLTYPNVDGASGDYLTTDGAGNLSFAALPVEDLQSITDNGATTTNSIDVAGLTSAGLIYPLADGVASDVLITDGAGNLSFSALPTETLQSVTDDGATTTNSIDVAGLTAAGLIYPLIDGTADQVVSTDGAGNLGWLSTLKVVTAPTASTDAGALGQVAVGAGFFYFFDGTQWLQVAGSTF